MDIANSSKNLSEKMSPLLFSEFVFVDDIIEKFAPTTILQNNEQLKNNRKSYTGCSIVLQVF